MVITSLYRDDVYPLIRFNTHDLSAWKSGTSSLGFQLQRTVGVLGRSDNMVKLRGINVYPLRLRQSLTSAVSLLVNTFVAPDVTTPVETISA